MPLGNLFWAFFKVGILGYGGGPGSVGLIESQVVGEYHWLSANRFSEMLAVAYTLPGPLATKLAGMVGFEQAGVFGAVVAVLATVVPSLLAMLALYRVLLNNRQVPWVAGLIKGIQPVVVVILVLLVVDLVPGSFRQWQAVALGVLSLALIRIWHWPIVLVVLLAAGYGVLLLRPN